MRILWFSSDPLVEAYVGSTEMFEAVRYLSAKGNDVRLVTGARPGDRPVGGTRSVLIVSAYRPFLAWRALWPGVTRELHRAGQGADVIVSDPSLLPPVIRWVGQRLRHGLSAPKILLHVRTVPVEAGRVRIAAQWLRFLLTLRIYGRRVDAVTAVSDALRRFVLRAGGFRPSLSGSWSASGCRWCDAPPPETSWPSELDPALKGRFLILYVGSLTSGRGLSESIRALRLVRRRAPDMSLVMLGAGPSVPMLKALTKELGLEDAVAFVDPVPHDRVAAFIRVADVGLVPLPARWKWQISTPIKLAEYLCLGLPVVITEIDAHRILPTNAPFAFVAPTADPEHLSAALLGAYARRGELDVLSQAALEWAGPRLGWSRQLVPLESILHSLVEPRP